MRNALRSHKVYVPLITVLGAASLFFLYYVFYVSWQRSYADERAFRLLSVVSDQLSQRFDHVERIMGAAYVSPNPVLYLKSYLKDRGSNIVANEALRRADPHTLQRDGSLRIKLIPDPNDFSFRVEYRSAQSGGRDREFCDHGEPALCADVSFDADLNDRVHNVTQEYFDDILIATARGDVIFQKSVSGLRVTNLNSLLPSAPPEKPRPEGGTPPPKESPGGRSFAEISQFSNVVLVDLAGAAYKLYVQPVPLAMPDDKGENLRPVICGLWRSDRFQSEVVSIPYSMLIWTALLLAAAFALVWPVLKVAYMSPAERLRRLQVFHLLLSTLVATALLTLVVLNCAYGLRARQQSRNQLAALAERVDRNVKAEIVRSLAFLRSLREDQELLHEGLRLSQTPLWRQPAFLNSYAARFAAMRNARLPGYYPYFGLCFWADSKGRQQFKITVRSVATPATQVDKEGYFRAVLNPQDLPRVSRRDFGDILAAHSGWDYLNGTRFHFDSRYSPNSGEFFVLLSVPYTTPPAWTDLPPAARDLKAQVLLSQFLSLVDPVIPAGYGFAVLDHAGMVQFHSAAGRNKIEDFFKECRQDSSLKALVAQGSQDFLVVNYMGTQHQLLVRPMPYLGEPAYTLVVFRDCNYFTTVNVASILVFLLLASLFGIPFLIALAVAVFRHRDYPLEAVWPVPSETPKYLNVIVANICLAAAFGSGVAAMEMNQTLVAVVVAVGAAVLFACLKPEWAQGARALPGKLVVLAAILAMAQSRGALLAAAIYAVLSIPPVAGTLLRHLNRRISCRQLYVAAAFTMLTAIVVVPCFGLFKISYNTVNRLALQSAQVARKDQLQHRAEAAREHFRELAADPAAAYIQDRLAEDLDRYDRPIFTPSPIPASVQQAKLDVGWLEPLIARAAAWFPSNGLGAAMREVALGTQDQAAATWRTARNGNEQLLWWKGLPPELAAEGDLPGSYPRWGLPNLAVGLLCLLAVVLAIWLDYLAGKIFVAELGDLAPLPTWDPDACRTGNLLIIGHPRSGKSACAAGLAESRILDLAQMSTPGRWALEAIAEPTVIVDHFEFDLDNPDACLSKLRLLEQLLYVRKRRVVLLSTVDPMFYLVAGAPEILTVSGEHPESPQRLLDRWSGVLSHFQKIQPDDFPDEHWRRLLKQNPRTGWQRALLRLVIRECAHTAQLRQIGLSLVEEHLDRGPIPAGQVLEELRERADAYYRVLWSTCTRTERLVLYQLSQDGWANPQNGNAIRQLLRRRIIRRESCLQIMNQTFRRFVQTAQCPEEVARWEEEERHSSWSAVKLALGTAIAVFFAWLLYSQREILQVGMGYIAALGAASGAVVTVVRNLSGSSAGRQG